jgi:hydroxylamine reductase (hybrid-cluster protein)
MAAHNLARAIAVGVAAHSDHARDVAVTLLGAATGHAPNYRVRDVTKLHALADYMGVPTQGREVSIAPEWMSEKALVIGAYFVGSGAYVLFGVSSPVEASTEVTALISQGWEEQTGSKLDFVAGPEEMVRRALVHIDRKRAELGLREYDPTLCRWNSAICTVGPPSLLP